MQPWSQAQAGEELTRPSTAPLVGASLIRRRTDARHPHGRAEFRESGPARSWRWSPRPGTGIASPAWARPAQSVPNAWPRSVISGAATAHMGLIPVATRLRREPRSVLSTQFQPSAAGILALENVVMPQLIRGLPKAEARERAAGTARISRPRPRATASSLGAFPAASSSVVANRARREPTAPRLLLADEPTGNLDPQTAGHVFTRWSRWCAPRASAALIATHNVISHRAWIASSPLPTARSSNRV